MSGVTVIEWLKSLMLEKYEKNFLTGGYDLVGQCIDMTERDLVNLNITSPDDIKRIVANLTCLKLLLGSSHVAVKKDIENYENESLDIYENVNFNDTTDVYGNLERAASTARTSEFSPLKSAFTDFDFEFDSMNGRISHKTPVPAPRKLSTQSTFISTLNVGDTLRRDKKSDAPHTNQSQDFPMTFPNHVNGAFNESSLKQQVNVVRPYSNEETVFLENIFTDQDFPENNQAKPKPIACPRIASDSLLEDNIFATSGDQNKVKDSCLNKGIELNRTEVYENETAGGCEVIDGLLDQETSSQSSTEQLTAKESDLSTMTNLILNDSDWTFLENITNGCERSSNDSNATNEEKVTGDSLLRPNDRLIDYSFIDDRNSIYSIPPPSFPPPPLIFPNSDSIEHVPTIPPRPESTKKNAPDISNSDHPPSFIKPIYPILPDKALKPDINVLKLKHPSPTSPTSPPPPTMPRTKLLRVVKVQDDTSCDSPKLQQPPSSLSSSPPSSLSSPPPLPSPSLTSSPFSMAKTSAKVSNPDTKIKKVSPPSLVKIKDQDLKFNSKFGGILMKVEHNLKSSSRKHFLLDGDSLIYSDADRKGPTESIALRKITSITARADYLPMQHTFEIFFKSNDTPLILMAEEDDQKEQWIINISKSVAFVRSDELHNIIPFDKGGNVYLKTLPTSDEWHMTWVQVCGCTIYCNSQEERFEQFDLRTVKNLKYLTDGESCKMVYERGDPILIELYGVKLLLQGHTKLETASWLKVLNNTLKSFDISNLHKQFMNADNIPVVVDKCIFFVSAFGMETEGIYRLSGQNSKVSKLLEILSEDVRSVTINQSDFQVHEVTNCLKRYLRQLDEPLFTSGFHLAWIEAQTIKDKNQRLILFKEILNSLPLINYATIKFIINHLSEIAKLSNSNKMGPVNIASIFGPILLGVERALEYQDASYQSTAIEINVVKEFIDNYSWLFDVKAEEKKEDDKIKEALRKMNLLNKTNFNFNDQSEQVGSMLISVVVGPVDKGETTTFNLTSKTTVGDLMERLSVKYMLTDADQWVLFEVVCDGELERIMYKNELVMSTMLQYRDWPPEFCVGNMIQYKQTDRIVNLQKFMDSRMSMYSELRYACKKSFKKYYFEFAKYNLAYRKDAKSSTTLNSWKIEDIKIFFGVQKKRSPPTVYGFSFYQANSPLVNGFFGHSICCSNLIELYKWLSILLHAQCFDMFCTNNRKSRSLSDLSLCSTPEETSLGPTFPGSKPFKQSFKKSPKISSSMKSSNSSSSVQSSSASVFYIQQSDEAQTTSSTQAATSPLSSTTSSATSVRTTAITSAKTLTTTTTDTSNANDGTKISAVSKLFAKFMKQ